MLALKSPLALPITHRARHHRAHTANRLIAHAVAQIAQLGFRFLRLAFAVLVLAGALQVGGTEDVTESFFAGADGLVIGAGCAGGSGGGVGGVC